MVARCIYEIKIGSRASKYLDDEVEASAQDLKTSNIPWSRLLKITNESQAFVFYYQERLCIRQKLYDKFNENSKAILFNRLASIRKNEFPWALRYLTHVIEVACILPISPQDRGISAIYRRGDNKSRKGGIFSKRLIAPLLGKGSTYCQSKHSPFKPNGPWQEVSNPSPYEFTCQAELKLEKRLSTSNSLWETMLRIDPLLLSGRGYRFTPPFKLDEKYDTVTRLYLPIAVAKQK